MDGRIRIRRRRLGGAIAIAVAAAIVGGGAIVAVQAATPSVTTPPVGARFDYQLGGAYAPAAGVRIVDRDREDPPSAGRYSVCYLNGFQTQPQEARYWLRHHPTLLLRTSTRKPVEDPDWPGEYVLDITTARTRAALAGIVGRWIDGCADAGYQAVEPDNLDTFTRWPKRITEADALAYARLLAVRAHRRGLAVAQKNAPDLGGRGGRSPGSISRSPRSARPIGNAVAMPTCTAGTSSRSSTRTCLGVPSPPPAGCAATGSPCCCGTATSYRSGERDIGHDGVGRDHEMRVFEYVECTLFLHCYGVWKKVGISAFLLL